MLKASLIITMQNSSKTISKCLDSILNQTFQNIEAIIIDMNSTDNSCSVCEKYTSKDHRIKLVTQGPSNQNLARNLGLKIAKGDYLMFVNSDDYLDPNAIEKSLSISQKTNSDIVIFEWYEQTPKGMLPAPIPCKIRNNTLAIVGDILGDRQPAYIWNKLYAISLWQDTRFISLEKETDVIKRLFSKANKAFYLPIPLCVHNNPSSINTSKPHKIPMLKITHFLTSIVSQLSGILE